MDTLVKDGKDHPNPRGGKAYTKGWVSHCCPGGLASLLPIGPSGSGSRLGLRPPPWPSWASAWTSTVPPIARAQSPAWVFPSGLPGPPRPRSALSSRLAGPVRVRPSVGPRPPVRGPRPPVRRSVAAVPSVRSVWARCRGSLVLLGRHPGFARETLRRAWRHTVNARCCVSAPCAANVAHKGGWAGVLRGDTLRRAGATRSSRCCVNELAHLHLSPSFLCDATARRASLNAR